MSRPITVYVCMSDRFTNDPNNNYESVAEFNEMCHEAFGAAPDLQRVGTEWHDSVGLVLVEVVL